MQREDKKSALRPAKQLMCVVMACSDTDEARQVAELLEELNTGCLVTYSRVEDMLQNPPVGKVALFILATDESPAVVSRTLVWLRQHWPKCPLTVVGDDGCGLQELTARQAGASFVTRPVNSQQWMAILSHALSRPMVPAAPRRTIPTSRSIDK